MAKRNRPATPSPKRDIHLEVADRIATMLEQGVTPWRKPWSSGSGLPSNAKTGRRYSGLNSLLLAITAMDQGYTSSRWLTFKQAKDLGGHVRKGERGTLILIFKEVKRKDATRDDDTYRLASSATVFNVDQCDGLGLDSEAPRITDPVQAADELVAGYLATGPRLAHGGDAAMYVPSLDLIGMPARSAFHSPAGYYGTLFHEIGHSTGHSTRLDRDLASLANVHRYAREELVAEFSAAFLSAHAGIDDDREIENAAAYLASWAAKIRDDPKVLAWAASQAQKAVDLVLAQQGAAAAAA